VMRAGVVMRLNVIEVSVICPHSIVVLIYCNVHVFNDDR